MAKIIRSEPLPLQPYCLHNDVHRLVKFDEERMVCTACGGVLFVAEAKPEPPHYTLMPCTLPHFPCNRPHYYGSPTIWWGSSDTGVSVSGTIIANGNATNELNG